MADDTLVPIPGLGHEDAMVVQALLRGAGFFFHRRDGFGECPDIILIRAEDVAAIKAFVGDYKIRGPRDVRMPIPW